MLTSTVTVPIYGKLSDLYGRKVFFMFGMVVFMVGSVLSGGAATMTQLIIFRGVQGIGAGALMPVALAVIGDLFPPGQRGKVQGLMGTVFGIASVVGPTLGGYITDNLNWSWVLRQHPRGNRRAHGGGPHHAARQRGPTGPFHRLSGRRGACCVHGPATPGAVSGRGDHPWLSPYILGLFAVSAVMLALFLFIESRADFWRPWARAPPAGRPSTTC